jgi:lysophospholipase L1-like esterase
MSPDHGGIFGLPRVAWEVIPVRRNQLLRVIVGLAGVLGGVSGMTYGVLTGQSRRARKVIGVPIEAPLRADGCYLPDGSGPLAPSDPAVLASPEPLLFTVIGDSSAAGLGAGRAAGLPGVLLARAIADETGRPVRLDTVAVSGTSTLELADQIDTVLLAPPDVALMIIGANDVTTKLRPATSGRLLALQLGRLRDAGVPVVLATCPDLGAIRPIPQPLRTVARHWSLMLAGVQRAAAIETGARPVALADLLSPEFVARPNELFSADRFHPSEAGYEAAAAVLLPALCAALDDLDPSAPTAARTPVSAADPTAAEPPGGNPGGAGAGGWALRSAPPPGQRVPAGPTAPADGGSARIGPGGARRFEPTTGRAAS